MDFIALSNIFVILSLQLIYLELESNVILAHSVGAWSRSQNLNTVSELYVLSDL